MNVFMISDASYCPNTKKAGIAVVDTFSGNKYSTMLTNIRNSQEAEFTALVYSIKIALNKGYKDVVFVYDCQGIDLSNLQKYIQNKFTSSQFLWLVRDFTKDADNLARKALKLARSLKILKTPKEKAKEESKMKKQEEKKYNSLIIHTFTSYNYKHILKACMATAD